MANPLDENVTAFLDSVFNNDTLLQTERKQLIHAAMQSLQSKIEDGTHRWGASVQFGDFIKEARRPRKKGRSESEAMGFFGNWAKSREEKVEVEEYDDHYSGC